jgi:hypothetical protein
VSDTKGTPGFLAFGGEAGKTEPEVRRRAGMTEEVEEGVIPAKAGIQVFVPEEVLG